MGAAQVRASLRVLTAGALLSLCPALAAGQSDSVVVVPSDRYDASALHQWLLGTRYRDAWATTIRVPVLDIDTFAGGLTPVRRGGGQQTRSLRLRAESGREYNFRSVDKWVTPAPREDLEGTVVERLVQDQISSLHPSAVPVATGLLDAVSVLNPSPWLVVMPDHPRLGEFRESFAGMLGTLEIHADASDDWPGFAGAVEVESSEDVIEAVLASPTDRIDAAAYLRDRLMSLLMGDWDRHAGQFRWARFESDGIRRWVPVPEDRDYAFSDYDGKALSLLRANLPKMVTFRDRYPRKLAGLTLNSAEIDRRFLGGVSRSLWRETVASLKRDLSDAEIEAAVRRMPAEHFALAGEELVRTLRLRRDSLHVVAVRFYLQLAAQPELHATDQPERAEVTRLHDGSVRVLVTSLADSTRGAVLFDRTFLPDETNEISLDLRGGADAARITGRAGSSIRVRVLGGAGADTLVDEAVSGAWTYFHDEDDEGVYDRGRATVLDRSTYEEPLWVPGVNLPPVDYGGSISWFEPWLAWEGTQGVIVGGGPSLTRLGFRRFPYAARASLRAMYGLGSGRAALDGQVESIEVGSKTSSWLHVRVSGMEALRFHGFGNETPEEPVGDEIVRYQQRLGELRLAFRPTDELRLAAGPVIEWLDPQAQGVSHPLVAAADREPYGKVGLAGSLRLDTRPARGVLDGGFTLDAEARAFPATWGLRSPFARFAGTMTGYADVPGRALLAARVGGAQVSGDAPLLESVSLGGSETVRGYHFQRFTGDALLFGGLEARGKLARVRLLVNADLGLLAFTEAGRVYVDGESEGGWHASYGAGVWLGSVARSVSATLAVGESPVLYLKLGLPY